MCAEKQALRQLMRKQRASESVQTRQQYSQAITDTLLTLPQYLAADTVFCYCATEEEIATDAIMADLLARGKRLCVPRCERPGIMTARQIDSLQQLIAGKFGIREPSLDRPILPPAQIDLCIVPCLCADSARFRLGYGGGYYDRFLAQTSAYSIALCADARFLPSPFAHDSYDIPCDCILTERRVHT